MNVRLRCNSSSVVYKKIFHLSVVVEKLPVFLSYDSHLTVWVPFALKMWDSCRTKKFNFYRSSFRRVEFLFPTLLMYAMSNQVYLRYLLSIKIYCTATNIQLLLTVLRRHWDLFLLWFFPNQSAFIFFALMLYSNVFLRMWNYSDESWINLMDKLLLETKTPNTMLSR